MKFYNPLPLPEDHIDLTKLCEEAEKALGSVHTGPQLEYDHPVILFKDGQKKESLLGS